MYRAAIVLMLVPAWLCSATADAPQAGYSVEFEFENNLPPGTLICVPLSVPEARAGLTRAIVRGSMDQKVVEIKAQVAAPGLATEKTGPRAKGEVRRDLIFAAPALGAGKIRVKAELQEAADSNRPYTWRDQPGEYAELSYDKVPVLRYVYKAYDKSTPQNRDKTYKVFHHLYDPLGKRFLTNGGDTNVPATDPKKLLYPHHRGLMYAFNKITFNGKTTCDTWHAKPGDTHEQHHAFLAVEEGSQVGRHRVAIDWHGPKNEVFLTEERELSVHEASGGVYVDFVSRLKSTGGTVKLDGDPQHAGFQFRAHNDVQEQKANKQTYYLRPDGRGGLGEPGTRNWDPKTGKGPVDLGWDVLCFVLDGKRYSVVYMDHPDNPHPSRWSERDYGRFGCYFEAEVTESRPLQVSYRIWLQEGEIANQELPAAMARAFAAPPKITMK